jgi:RNA polymerase sigma-70 factor, ECF subfamily
MPTERPSDPDLVRRCRQGDPEAWRLLVRRHTPLAYRLALRMLRRPAEAEDATQEVFLRVHRSLGSYDPARPLAPWIGQIAYHACLRRLHGSGRLAGDDAALAEVADDRPAPEDAAATQEAGALLERAIETLAAQDRALLVLRYREGLSDSEVAEATGMPEGTVKTRTYRARARLRELLGPLMRED